ncbi:response regulator transcription factor [Anaerolentibacter hominis]|uniref:response regulator transcription factor n=1 Tax=Anaerolentibacter hominis TaxID=3079009 RepID=UPI0031B88B56
MAKEILVVEDESDIQELLENFLAEAGYGVTLAADGVQALTLFREKEYDLVLLDIMLPKISGYGVCEVIRQQSGVPIIMLTALDSEENQIKGLDMQVDDYITKPFSMQILLRKIAAVLRRTSRQEGTEQLVYKDLVLDLDAYQAAVGGIAIELTHREFELLKELLTHQGRVMTRQMLLESLWQYDFFGDERVVDTHIKNLRKKLNVDYIETIRGVGYRVAKTN